MNKLISKIVGVALGLALATGVGAGVVLGNRSFAKADAVNTATYSLTPNQASTGSNSTSYITSLTEFTYSSVTWKMNQWNPSTLQIKTNQSSAASEFRYYNTSGFAGRITQVVMTFQSLTLSNTSSTGFMFVGGTSQVTGTTGGTAGTWDENNKTITWTPGSSDNFTYFAFYQNGKVATATNKLASSDAIVVTYELPSGPTLSVGGPAYLIDGGASGTITGTITNNNNYTITWSASDQHVSFNPATSASGDEVSVSFNGVTTGTTPIVITGTLNDTNTTTGTKNIYALEHAGTSTDPFSATDAMVFSHSDYAAQSGGDWYVEGNVVAEYRNAQDVVKGYYIDEDPTNTSSKKFEVYGFTNSDGKDIIVGTSYIKAHGAMTCYVNTSVTPNTKQAEFSSCTIYSIDNGAVPSVVIDGGNRTVDINDSLTLTATVENAPGVNVVWSSGTQSVATIDSSTGVVTLLSPGTTQITATITVGQDSYSNSIVLTVEHCPVEIGKTYIISAVYSETTYYLAGVSNSLGVCSTNQSDAMILTVEAGNTTGSFAFQNGGNYLKAKSGNNLETEAVLSDNSSWLVSNDGTKDLMKNVGQSTRLLSYNHNNDTGDNTKNRFAAYTSQQSAAISFTEVIAPEVDEVSVFGDASVDAEGAVSVTKEFLYEVTYVDSNNPGNQGVTVSVLNSNDETTGATVTSAPSNGSFEVTFTASDTYTVIVTSKEDPSISDSITIVVSNIYVAATTDFAIYSGTAVGENTILTEGDYVFYYNGFALKNTIASNRAGNETVAPANDVIATGDNSIVWHVAPNGQYFTIYNAGVNKYLTGNGTKNQAALSETVDDKALWSVTISEGSYEFVNKYNSANSVNANLRNNGTNGWACYSTGTGGAFTLYKKAYNAVEYSTVLTNYLGAVCDATTGNTNTTNLTNTWAILSAEYTGLDSTVKAALDDNSESSAVLAALSAYDYVVGKYNKTQGLTAINDFMGRDPAAVGAANLNLMRGVEMSNNALVIVIITAFVTTTFVGGYFFLRKKKEN